MADLVRSLWELSVACLWILTGWDVCSNRKLRFINLLGKFYRFSMQFPPCRNLKCIVRTWSEETLATIAISYSGVKIGIIDLMLLKSWKNSKRYKLSLLLRYLFFYVSCNLCKKTYFRVRGNVSTLKYCLFFFHCDTRYFGCFYLRALRFIGL